MSMFALAIGNIRDNKSLEQEVLEALMNSLEPLSCADMHSILKSRPCRETLSREVTLMCKRGLVEQAGTQKVKGRREVWTYRITTSSDPQSLNHRKETGNGKQN